MTVKPDQERPASLDGTLINSVEPIPPKYRAQFIKELRGAGRIHLAADFVRHWAMRDFDNKEGEGE